MAVPAFWNTPFSYTEIPSTADVANLLPLIRDACIAVGWTDETALPNYIMKTPSRSDGVFFKVLLAKISATRWGFQMYDQAGVNVCGTYNYCQDIEAAGNIVQVFAGPMHLAISSARPTYESSFFCVLDQTPEPINFPQAMYIAYCGPRTSDGTLRNYGWNFNQRKNPGDSSYHQKQSAVQRTNGGGWHRKTMALTTLFAPAEYCDSGLTPPMFLGRVPQAIVIDDAGLSPGSEVTVPIDAGVNAVFKLLGCGTFAQQRIAFRKS